jgi:hypothetical protein
MRSEAPPCRAPRSRLRPQGSGWAVAARGFFVWEESRRHAQLWERQLAGRAEGLRASGLDRSSPVAASSRRRSRRRAELGAGESGELRRHQ